MQTRNVKSLVQVLIALLVFPCSVWAWSGKVVDVADGDTITVLRDKKQVRIMLYGMDTPEKGQAFGNEAKQFTSKMVYGKVVEVEVMDTDRYGWTAALVAVNKQILNEELLKAGYAWVYYQHCHEMICHAWADFQFAAKLDKRGLWSEPSPIPPWEFRRKKRRK